MMSIADGDINVVDATLVQKYIVGLEEFDDYTFKIGINKR